MPDDLREKLKKLLLYKIGPEGPGFDAYDVADCILALVQRTPSLEEPTEAMLDAGMNAFGETELIGTHFMRRALAAAYTAMHKARS